MIVSFEHNYIYFRPKKTGSSTIVSVLKQSLGEEDISKGKDLNLEAGERSHVKAELIKKIIPPDFWDRAFKFASERHPYEKAVSLAYFRLGVQQQERQQSEARSIARLPKLLDRIVASGDYCGFPYYAVDGKAVVTEFIRHETLEADLRRVTERLNIPFPESLPRKKGAYRLDKRPAREILSKEQMDIIFERCRPEFELLGYER